MAVETRLQHPQPGAGAALSLFPSKNVAVCFFLQEAVGREINMQFSKSLLKNIEKIGVNKKVHLSVFPFDELI